MTRNKVATPLNPFFISKKGIFKAEILSAQVPGESKKERLHYITFLLKVPKESTLVSFEFINGNEWITFNFEEEEDIKNCIEKHNNKYLNETFKLTYLKGPEKKKVVKYHKIQKETVEKICHNPKPSILLFAKVTNGTPAPDFKERKKQKDQSLKEKANRLATNKPLIDCTKNNNPYGLIAQDSEHKIGALTNSIPGANRLKQIENLSQILEIPMGSEYISQTSSKIMDS